jgi:hypothetical protein
MFVDNGEGTISDLATGPMRMTAGFSVSVAEH